MLEEVGALESATFAAEPQKSHRAASQHQATQGAGSAVHKYLLHAIFAASALALPATF